LAIVVVICALQQCRVESMPKVILTGLLHRICEILPAGTAVPPDRCPAGSRLAALLPHVERWPAPAGEFHLVDFGPPRNAAMRLIAALLRPLEHAADHFDGILPAQIAAVGFDSVLEVERFDTALGPLVMVRGTRPQEA
jgi:hypothetical protein